MEYDSRKMLTAKEFKDKFFNGSKIAESIVEMKLDKLYNKSAISDLESGVLSFSVSSCYRKYTGDILRELEKRGFCITRTDDYYDETTFYFRIGELNE